MKIFLLLKTALLFLLLSGCASKTKPEISPASIKTEPEKLSISISFNPPMPFKNLIANPGFEEGLKAWKAHKAQKDSKVYVNKIDSCKGQSSLIIIKKNKVSSDGVYQTKGAFKSLPKKGKEYILSCSIKGDREVSNIGGISIGAGVTLGIYDKTWKKSERIDARSNGSAIWKKLRSEPFTIPEWAENYQFSASISYSKGIALIDCVSLQEAYTNLTFTVTGKDIVQIILENSKGKALFYSGRISPPCSKFTKTLKVLSTDSYTVRAIDSKGNVFTKSY
jgi:hypothetical protein